MDQDIIHICRDEKVINHAYEIFNRSLPHRNKFLILLDDPSQEKKYAIKDNFHYVFINDNLASQILYHTTNSVKYVLFHGMSYEQARILFILKNKDVKLVWSMFGSEVYNNPLIYGIKTYGNQTLREFLGKKFLLKILLSKIYYRFSSKERGYNLVNKALNSVDFFASFFEEEYNELKQNNVLNPQTRFLPFSYYPVELALPDIKKAVRANKILIGNSASPTNNHIEIFRLLKKVKDIQKREIIIPLNYGDPSYANYISNLGNQIFGDYVTCLTEFLSLKDYQTKTEECGFIFMNHYRQQAVGNIFSFLFVGAKVFLNKKNPIFKSLRNEGFIIFDLEKELTENISNVFKPLDSKQKTQNKILINEKLSLDNIANEIRKVMLK